MDLNILRIDVDRAHRVSNTQNLSLNQCSNNNQIRVYYEGEYDFIQMSFRKPDGWLSDKVTLIFEIDEDGYKYAYYDVDEEFTSFIMGGRNAILQANLYFNIRLNATEYQTATAGNIRINVNYVDDALVNTNFSQAYMNNVNATVGALQNDFNKFKTGDIEVGSSLMDGQDNVIHNHYETKSDSRQKYDDLNTRKLDKTDVQDQTDRLIAVETNILTTNGRVSAMESNVATTSALANLNKTELDALKTTTIKEAEFEKAIQERIDIETKLQEQIDNVSAASNVKDMVASYSDLQSYDKTKLNDGDRIQVLTDAFYGGVPTVYKWDAEAKEFVFIGKYASASYTKAEIDSQYNVIKNTIPNRAVIENGELIISKGTTPISTSTVNVKTVNGESIWGEGNIVIPVDSEFSQTSTNPVENRLITNAILQKASAETVRELQTAMEGKADIEEVEKKQDKLEAGPNIKIENGVISVTGAISLELIPEGQQLPAIGSNNIIYIYKPSNETAYSEYLWIESEARYEPFGEAGLKLDDFLTEKEIKELLAFKADLEFVNTIDARVTRNTTDIAAKADRETTAAEIGNLSSNILNLWASVSNKAEREEVAFKRDLDDLASTVNTKQEKLVSGANIKQIRTADGLYDVLGSGELFISNATITDLGLYYTKEEAAEELALKADKTELFDKDYNKLKNLPDLAVYAYNSDLDSTKNALLQEIDKKQNTLKSGSNIKTINGMSLLVDPEAEEPETNLTVVTDLSDYYTKSEVDNAVNSVDVSDQLKSYATQVWVSNQGYLKNVEAAQIYATITQIPTVPTKLSAFDNDVPFLKESTLPKNLSYYNNDAGFLLPSDIENKQDKLVSGTNIKTINGSSILGNGDIKIVTDISHLETKDDATAKLAEAKAYSDSNKNLLQTAVNTNTASITSLNTAITTEKENRIGAVARLEGLITANDGDISTLQTGLSTETAERRAADTQVLADAKAYVDSALGGDDGILEAIETIREQLGEGAVDIMASINQNKSDIAGVRKDLTDNVSTINSNVSAVQTQSNTNKTNIANITTALETEVSERKAADNAISDRINTNSTNINTLTTNLNTEATTRENADTALSTRITNLNNSFETHKTTANDRMVELGSLIEAEQAARVKKDGEIEASISNFTNTVNSKVSTIESSIATNQSIINKLQKDVGDNKTDADTKISNLDTKIGNKILFKNWITA